MKKTPHASDICLVLEGTYPYVSGGVSTWVHQLLTAFPDLRFSIFYLGAQKDPAAKPKYTLPPNLVEIREAYLFDPPPETLRLQHRVPRSWQPFYEDLRKLLVRQPTGSSHDFELIQRLVEHIGSHSGVSYSVFWNDRATWTVLREIYDRYAAEDSFLDFFWTCRFLIQPLWNLARALPQMPDAKVYHTACTGYAGLAAALAGARRQRPVLLTEHGIYLRERINDICRSQWLVDALDRHPALQDPISPLRRLWIGFFDLIGRLCYLRSAEIVSLFDRNASAQRHFGADPDQIRIIPNGIRTQDYDPLTAQRHLNRAQSSHRPTIGFLGRVVSIKDIKTLIRTAAKVIELKPNVQFLIAGHTDEEPDYFKQCQDLVLQLGIDESLHFLGPQQRDAFLPRLDLMILTSISEGLPFVILEALAAEIPVISTDVGACSELILGSPDETPACGPAGRITEVGAPEQLAHACLDLLSHPQQLDDLGRNGRRRVETRYHEDAVLSAYLSLYQHHLNRSSAPTDSHPTLL